MARLAEMLEAQLRLQQDAFGLDPTRMEGAERMRYLRDNVLALTDELHEVLAETGWKPWSTSHHVNVDNALNEMADAQHFFLNILLVLGQPDEDALVEFCDLFELAYFTKVGVNIERQALGYTGLDKCPECHRDLATVMLLAIEDSDGRTRQACPCGKVLPA